MSLRYLLSRCGGIGRHAVLRGQCRKACRFDSGHRHHRIVLQVLCLPNLVEPESHIAVADGVQSRSYGRAYFTYNVGHDVLLELYLPILIFVIVALAIGGASLAASYGVGTILNIRVHDTEKLSPYECGFEAFEDARMKFDVRYYLVAILFILFDLEITFLFPWAVVINEIGLFGYFAMMLFLGILIVGFIYEWKKGALDWE